MIQFSYTIESIVNNAQILSLLRTNSMQEKGSETVVDDYAINDEEEPLVKKYLKSGCSLIADTLSGYARDLLDEDGVTALEAFEFDTTVDAVEDSFVFRVNMPDLWPTSAMTLCDEAIKDASENYVLYRIAAHKMIESNSYFQLWEEARGQLRALLSRRTDTVKRNYNHF